MDLNPTGEIVAERFTVNQATAKKAPHTESLAVNYAVEYELRKRGRELPLQLPVQAKKLATDKVLRKLGWYVASKGGHANDGARHLVLRLLQHKVLTPAMLLD